MQKCCWFWDLILKADNGLTQIIGKYGKLSFCNITFNCKFIILYGKFHNIKLLIGLKTKKKGQKTKECHLGELNNYKIYNKRITAVFKMC